MKWKYESLSQKIDRLSEWHKWFAWYPVFYKGQAYWFCVVERRLEWQLHAFSYCYAYRECEVLK